MSFGNKKFNSEVFFIISCMCLLFVSFKTSSKSYEKKIKASISVNIDEVSFLDQKRNPKLLQTQYFETLDFPKNSSLTHSSGEILGFYGNYFIEFEAKAEIKTTGSYSLTVETDDGYRLIVDGKKIAEHSAKKETSAESFELILAKGNHFIQLQYFQALGDATARVHYTTPNQKNRPIPLGEDSKSIYFTKWE